MAKKDQVQSFSMSNKKYPRIEMELTPEVFATVKETFDLDIELIEGTVEEKNGMIFVDIHVSDEKMRMFKDLFAMLISVKSNQIQCKIMGVPVTQN